MNSCKSLTCKTTLFLWIGCRVQFAYFYSLWFFTINISQKVLFDSSVLTSVKIWIPVSFSSAQQNFEKKIVNVEGAKSQRKFNFLFDWISRKISILILITCKIHNFSCRHICTQIYWFHGGGNLCNDTSFIRERRHKNKHKTV